MELLLDRPRAGLTSRIFNRIEDIPREVWNGVFPDVLESYSFLKSLDESGFKQFSFRYVLVYEGDAAIAAAPCFVMDYPLDTTVRGWTRALMLGIKKVFPGAFHLKALICGLPVDQGRIGIKNGNPRAALSEILACMEKIAGENRIGILAFKDFGCEYMELLDPIQTRGFYKIQDMPSTEMNLDFATFEEYLKTLSRVSRDGLKRKLKKIDQGPKIDLEIMNRLPPDMLAEAYALYRQTVAQSDDQFEVAPVEFFSRVTENMPEETRFFLWKLEGRMVAFAYCLVSGEHFIDFYLGFDYAVAHAYHLYFVRFRDLMNWCLKHKIKKYEMGPTGYEAKRRLGFRMLPLYIYAKHRNRWIDPFFKLLCRSLKPENHQQIFKDMREENTPCQKKD